MPEEAEDAYELTLEGAGISLHRTVDQSLAFKIIALLMGEQPSAAAGTSGEGAPSRQRVDDSSGASSRPKRAARGRAPRPHSRARSAGIVRDLSLRPTGKQSFTEFASEKAPRSLMEKSAVAVFYLSEILEVASVSVDHVNTCYRGADWRRPADLENSLQVTASQKGWLDTSDMNQIKLTAGGEDFVRHELPRSTS